MFGKELDTFERMLHVESGKRQHDKAGNVIRSPKGATGIAQVMPATGPEAAKDAGLPWDPKRFESDAEYNQALGSAYYSKLKKKYGGDERLASAAYNGGPGRLDKRIAKYGRASAINYMPEETRNYVAKVHGGQAGRSKEVARNVDIKTVGIEELLGSVEAAASGERFDIINPYEAGPELKKRSERIEGVLTEQDKFLDTFQSKLEETQASRRERTERTIAIKQNTNESVQEATAALAERVKPIIAAREQTNSQMERLATMNPLERGLRGIFDLNYNQGYLEKRLQDLDGVLQNQGKDYEFLTGIREKFMQTLDREDQMGDEMDQLTYQELDEDGKMISMSLSAANQSFGSIVQQVEGQENLIRAQILSTDKYLSERTADELAALEGEAGRTKGGRIVIDGVELTQGEIKSRRMSIQAQEMAFESQQLALQGNKIELANKQGDNWARHATLTQLQAAAANGGVAADGTRIPQDALSAHIRDRLQRNSDMANQTLLGDPNRLLVQQMGGLAQDIKTLSARSATVFGQNVPVELKQQAQQLAVESQQIAQMVQEAQKQGTGREVQAALLQRVGKMREQLSQRVDGLALKMSGGDKKGAQFMSSYLKADPMDATAAADAMLHFAQKGGLPSGMRASPAARAAFAATQEAINAVDAGYKAQGKKPTKEQRDLAIRMTIQKVVPGAYNQNAFNELISAIPDIAKKTGDEFAGVNRADFDSAMRQGEVQSKQEIARTLGIKPSDVDLLFAGKYKGDNAGELTRRVQNENLKGELAARQQAIFLDALDRSPSANANFKPSRALADMLSKPQFYEFAGKFEQVSGSSSFGDYMAQSISNGTLAERTSMWAKGLKDAVTDGYIAEQSSGRLAKLQYQVDPFKRTATILGGLEGIDKAEETALLNAIRNMVPPVPNVGGIAVVKQRNDAIARVIKGQKFQDPNLERIRQLAAKQWDATAQNIDNAIDRYESE